MDRIIVAIVCALGIFAGASDALGEPYVVVPVAGRVDHAIDRDRIMYVTAGPSIVRYDLANLQFLPPFNIGGTLAGIDISPNGQTLAVADFDTTGTSSTLHLVDSQTGIDSPVSFSLSQGESGTYMAVWGGDSEILVSSRFSGSGWVPLRRYDTDSGTTQVIAMIRQNSMLAPSADLTTIGVAEGNISSGPVSAYSVSGESIVATTNTNAFLVEIAADPLGHQFAVPSYLGVFIFDLTAPTFQLHTILGQSASSVPIGAAYSPISPHLFTADYDYSTALAGVKVYDTTSLTLSLDLDTYPITWAGVRAFGNGRTRISQDGRWLGVSADSNVRVYDVSSITGIPFSAPEPVPATSTFWIWLAVLAVVTVAWHHSRLRPSTRAVESMGSESSI